MYIVTAAHAPRFHFHGIEFVGYAAPSRGSEDLCAWQMLVPAGLRSDLYQLNQDEILMVTSGTLRVSLGGPLLSTGDCVIVPAGTPIELSNPGDQQATAHVVVKAGFSATLADGTVIGTPPVGALTNGRAPIA